MLGTRRAANGPAFAVGWLAGLAIVGTIVLLPAGGNATGDTGAPAIGASALKLVFGVLFALMTARIWRGRPRPSQDVQLPKGMRSIDGFTAGKSLDIGVLLSAVNPTNLLTIAAATAIAVAGF